MDPQHVELKKDEEVSDQRVGALNPVAHYMIDLSSRAQFIIELREHNTASRVALLLSTQDPSPTSKSAMWANETSDPRKTIVVLPIDDRFTEGPCFVAVRYVCGSGSTTYSLKFTRKDVYQATWQFPLSDAFYDGWWYLNHRHGRGRCVYRQPKTKQQISAEKKEAAQNAADGVTNPVVLAILQTKRSEKPDELLLSGVTAGARGNRTDSYSNMSTASDSAAQISNGGAADGGYGGRGPMNDTVDATHVEEVYEGEWKMGLKDGQGTYTWADKHYTGYWRHGKRTGKGTLSKADGSTYTGEWRDDTKHGYGVQHYSNGTRYEGEWVKNKRHGSGVFVYDNNVRITGQWEVDVLVSNVTATYPDGTSYEGGWQDDSRHGQGTFRDVKGLVHEGTFDHNLKEGKGTWYLPRSVKFKGEWKADVRVKTTGEFLFPSTDVYRGDWDEVRHVRHGFGTCNFSNGDFYEGNWADDELSGKGILRVAGGITYEGAFATNLRHGYGRCEYADCIYQGEWYKDQRQGKGTCTYEDGTTYDGEWLADLRSGKGRLSNGTTTNDPGSWYDGHWENDAKNGFGVEYSVGKDEKYEGQWKDNRRCGEGTVTFSNGDKFTGTFKDDQRVDGKGTCVYTNGDIYTGMWKKEIRVGKGVCTYADGSKYDGEWANDVPSGAGTLYLSNGDVFQGTWLNGVRQDGHGKCIFANGNIYEGEWLNGVPHGQGVLTYTDSTVFDGKFEHGVHRL
jgi:hypothetical protein